MPTQRRVRAMKELSEIVASKRLEEVYGCVVLCMTSQNTTLYSMQYRLYGRLFGTCCSHNSHLMYGRQCYASPVL